MELCVGGDVYGGGGVFCVSVMNALSTPFYLFDR